MPSDIESGSGSVRARGLITEAAVIVASILLAFALDAWWDECQGQARLDEVLAAVADEFESEIAVLDSIIEDNQAGYEAYVRLIAATGPSESPLSDEELDALGDREPSGGIYESAFGTLATLTSSDLTGVSQYATSAAVPSERMSLSGVVLGCSSGPSS